MNLRAFVLVLAGLVGGYALSSHFPKAEAGAGGWACYVVDRLPDPKAAADWKGAKAVTEGLNTLSSATPSGTVLSVQYPVSGAAGFGGSVQSDVGLICIKQ
jgi:hypothetical protein